MTENIEMVITWLRNNYQDHPNIASLCDAMREALAPRNEWQQKKRKADLWLGVSIAAYLTAVFGWTVYFLYKLWSLA